MIVNSPVIGKTVPNGKKWTKCSDIEAFSIGYKDGIFLMTSSYPEYKLYYSENGTDWTEHTIHSSGIQSSNVILCKKDIWLVKLGGSFHVSYDGKTFEPVEGLDDVSLGDDDLHYEGGVYVVSSYDGVYYSEDDGKTWSLLFQGNTNYKHFVVYGKGEWVISNYKSVYVSKDCKSYEKTYTSSYFLKEINYNNGIYVLGTNDNGIMYSYDAITWYRSNITSGRFIEPIYYFENTWLTYELDSLPFALYKSKDGKTWSEIQLQSKYEADLGVPFCYNNHTLIFGGFYVDINGESKSSIYRSKDGFETFERIQASSEMLYFDDILMYAEGRFYATTARGLFYSETV